MKYVKIFIIILILTQLVTMGLLINNAKQKTAIIDSAYYDRERNRYIVRNKDTGNIVIAILLNADNTLFQCYINNESGTEISIDFFHNNEKSIAITDDNFSFFSTQYINPSGEVVVNRQETTAFFSRHSQFLKDGTLQQRNWKHDKQEWEIEVPLSGEWVDYFPVMETQID